MLGHRYHLAWGDLTWFLSCTRRAGLPCSRTRIGFKVRKLRDSNPRIPFEISGFQDRCNKPTLPNFRIKEKLWVFQGYWLSAMSDAYLLLTLFQYLKHSTSQLQLNYFSLAVYHGFEPRLPHRQWGVLTTTLIDRIAPSWDSWWLDIPGFLFATLRILLLEKVNSIRRQSSSLMLFYSEPIAFGRRFLTPSIVKWVLDERLLSISYSSWTVPGSNWGLLRARQSC